MLSSFTHPNVPNTYDLFKRGEQKETFSLMFTLLFFHTIKVNGNWGCQDPKKEIYHNNTMKVVHEMFFFKSYEAK